MKHADQNKIIEAGFVIVRSADFPSPCIKMRDKVEQGFRIFETFNSRIQRNHRLQDMLKDKKTVDDTLNLNQ